MNVLDSRREAQAWAFGASHSASAQGIRVEISFKVMAPRRLDKVENEQSYSKMDHARRLSSSCLRHVFQRASNFSLLSRWGNVSSTDLPCGPLFNGPPGEFGADEGGEDDGVTVPENRPMRRAFPIKKLRDTSAES